MKIDKNSLLGSAGNIYSLSAPLLARKQDQAQHKLRSVPPSHINLGPPLSKGERGGLIGVASKINHSGDDDAVNLNTRPLDEGAAKVALLIVDKVDKPRNTLMTFIEDRSTDLTAIGLGSQSVVYYQQGLTYLQASSYVWETYQLLNKREPGLWSLWQQRDTPVIPKNLTSPDLAFQIELTNGLIVPNAMTPYDDVLEFKMRHYDELISLRHHLEEFAIKLSKEGDPRAVNLERERFDISLSEYLKKARQSNIRKAVASLTTEFDWAAAVRGAVSGGGGGGLLAAAQGMSLTHTAAAIGGGVLASLSIKSTAGLKEGPSPFRYIARIEKEYGE